MLLWLSRKYGSRLKKGDVFLIYLVTYSCGPFLLEFLRLDPITGSWLEHQPDVDGGRRNSSDRSSDLRHRSGAGEPALAIVEGEDAEEGLAATEPEVIEPATDNGEPDKASTNDKGGQ